MSVRCNSKDCSVEMSNVKIQSLLPKRDSLNAIILSILNTGDGILKFGSAETGQDRGTQLKELLRQVR